ncbi:MAG: DUF4835 family protein [Bacteroidetes bacterium]|nr:DUF4835 family protein [Bacteroidota bacterium]
MRKLILIGLVLCSALSDVFAQELNCAVTVIAPRIQTSDRRVFTTLQTSVTEF